MNDLSVGVPDVEKLSNGAWSYAAVSKTQHLVRHTMTGITWWVESSILTDDLVDEVMDHLDFRLPAAILAAEDARSAPPQQPPGDASGPNSEEG